jgi:Zn-dependent protease with chaperone function
MTALPYLLHGTTLALAWFILLNVATSVVVAIVSARQASVSGTSTWYQSPAFCLALRLSPAVLSVLFVAVLFLPSYWRYEPREFVEGFDVSLTTLAIAATVIIGSAVARGVTAWRRAARRTAGWMRAARPLALTGISMPAFAIDTDAPIMALVGVLRPRLLITQPVLDALTDEELSAAVAHELGHRRALDNLKRLAMRAAPDLLSATRVARALERRWAVASEHAADRGAGDGDRARCALAAALVKVARLTPPVTPIGEPISALVDGGDITSRVQRLLDDAPTARRGRTARWLAPAIALSTLILTYTPLLRTVHAVTEILVNSLP